MYFVNSAFFLQASAIIVQYNVLLSRFRKKVTFTDWSNEAMKVGLCSVPPAGHPTSLLCLLNSSSMNSLFKNVVEQFTRLYRRKVMLIRAHICVRNGS